MNLKTMSDYRQYPQGTKVRLSTGEEGEAFESAFGYISIWVGDEDKCRYFNLNEVKFLTENDAKRKADEL